MPVRHNDGRPIDPLAFEQTREKLIAQFGALTVMPNTLLGVWVHEGVRYEDELLRLVIDVDDSAENRQFMAALKPTLLARFEQLEIYIASYRVEIL